MAHTRIHTYLVALLGTPLALGAQAFFAPSLGQNAPKLSPPQQAEFFNKQVKPLLEQNCLSCHSGDKPMGNLGLSKRADLLKGGEKGPALSPNKPAESLLLKAINYQGPKMPPAGKLPQNQIDILARWVKMGAPYPAAGAGENVLKHKGPPPVNAETKSFWSYQPIRAQTPPKVVNTAWVQNPIDAFVLKRLEKAGLKPNAPASKFALIRRATYDLLGLPPTPAEVRAFLADKSPKAYETLIDRLLASPHYGEKWGRHWLDLMRFAETNSYERDGDKPNAWRYRDYVINAFNQDKPYSQFIQEQLAGDEMPERTPERLIATGYYRLGLWDDEPADPKQALYDDLDDIATVTAQTFLGMTVNCARCHDHKIDPIPQKDYYRFLSFFNGVRRYGIRGGDSVEDASLRPIAPAPEVEKFKVVVAAHRGKMRANFEARERIERKAFATFAPVEKEDFRDENRRPDLLKKRVPNTLSQAEFDQYLALREERQKLERFQPPALDRALAVTEEGATPRDTFVLARGNPHVEGEKVTPGFPSVLSFPDPELKPAPYNDTSGRRTALARWISDKKNPLTPRVMVNRIWHYHFGQGIVKTPNDLGFQGAKPTHPELLDWLANDFVQSGWQMKPLHKKIMLSATYQMSAQSNAKALAKDPENDLLWRFSMRRLEAEEIRDSVLAANGTLNPKMAGPSIYPDMPAVVLAGQSVPGAGWGKSSEEEQARRSVYIFTKRSLVTPIIASFDGADTDGICPVRFATTQPTQALGMMNSEFINKQARIFAQYVQKQAGEKLETQVKFALWRVCQREPDAQDVARGVQLVQKMRSKYALNPEDALMRFCIVALNLNEFLYLD